MSKRSDKDWLADILEAIGKIEGYTQGYSLERFLEDGKTQDAVIRNLEVLGEATKQLSAELRKRHADIPWSAMAATRDRLVHGYFGINHNIVWQVFSEELPRIKPQLQSILETTS